MLSGILRFKKSNRPPRVVCLVPSLTELLFHLGVGDFVVGRTRFCIHPADKVGDVPIIGGTKNPRVEKIREIEPELIIANREENRKVDIDQLKKSTEVMLTEVESIEDALLTIYDIGERMGVEKRADTLIRNIKAAQKKVPDEPPQRVAYFIWRDPWMTVGRDTYIHSVLENWKLENVYTNKTRYPKTTFDELRHKDPELILLSSEPYPFKEKHLTEVSRECPNARVLLVDGEWFSWYGSRMLQAFRKMNSFRKAIS